MIAHYGFQDAQGAFFITIDGGKCAGCGGKPCLAACPQGLLVAEEDPYGDVAAAVADSQRRRIQIVCAACKPAGDRPPLPCVAACPFGALAHSW